MKECPSCKSKKVEIVAITAGGRGSWAVCCNECGVLGPLAKSTTDAERLWDYTMIRWHEQEYMESKLADLRSQHEQLRGACDGFTDIDIAVVSAAGELAYDRGASDDSTTLTALVDRMELINELLASPTPEPTTGDGAQEKEGE